MPKIPIDECPAGRAMDAAVAGALGFKVKWEQWIDERQPAYLAGIYANEYDGWAEHEDWRPALPYSTDIAAAWEMESTLEVDQQFDYVMALFNLVTVDLDAPDFHTFNKAMYWRMVHASPLDRCRAFLKANGVESVEVPNE